ncbi:hypothetical protein N665_0383s0122 [Sinapis alba]|nr:hypothetical protein N665_0383s0122 [Sinapis alba]
MVKDALRLCTIITFFTSVLSTKHAVLPKKVLEPVAITIASISPCLQVEPEKTCSPFVLVTGSDPPVSNDGVSFKKASICRNDISKLYANYITRYQDRRILILPLSISKNLAKRAIRAGEAFPALFSSKKLIIALISKRQTIPTKYSHSGP